LYGFKQAPRAWYKHLSSFLLENSFQRGKEDTILFRKDHSNDFFMVQIYVDDIIFGVIDELLFQECSSLM